MSKSHYGSKNSKQTDADGDWQGVPGVREMTEIKQQDHGDVFYHKQYVGKQLHNSQFFLSIFSRYLMYSNCYVISQPMKAEIGSY